MPTSEIDNLESQLDQAAVSCQSEQDKKYETYNLVAWSMSVIIMILLIFLLFYYLYKCFRDERRKD